MTTYTWQNASGGDWSAAPSWSSGAVPGSSDEAILPAGSRGKAYQVTIASTDPIESVGTLDFKNTAASPSLLVNGTLDVGTLIYNTGPAGISISAGGLLEITAAISAPAAETITIASIAPTGGGCSSSAHRTSIMQTSRIHLLTMAAARVAAR